MMRMMLLAMLCLGLGACSKPTNMAEKREARDVAMPMLAVSAPPHAELPAPQVAPPAPQAEAIAVSVPRMAYSYSYSFVLPGTSIAPAQEAHIALCDRLGPARCQLLAMFSETGGERAAGASLKLRVTSASAREFGVALEKTVSSVGGRAVNRSITAEDVSKSLVDTQARIHQRELLIERLTEILRTRKGTVEELVEAERSVAAAQEELDQAKGWLAELQGRVAMSTIDVNYAEQVTAEPTEHVGNSIGETLRASAKAFVVTMGVVLRLLIFAAPWLLLGAIVWAGVRRIWRRVRRATETEDDQAPEEEDPPS